MGAEHSAKQDGDGSNVNVASLHKVTSTKIKDANPSNTSHRTEHSVSKSKSTASPPTSRSLFSSKQRIKSKAMLEFKDMDLSSIKNGITGTYISGRVVRIAAEFWEENIFRKSLAAKLEFGCAIYFTMLADNVEMRSIFSRNLVNKQSIENSSMKFLDMIGWLLRSLLRCNVNLLAMLQGLGAMHGNMGICYHHFDAMLRSLHETFSYYFPIKYGIQIKYAIDQIFTLTARVMCGKSLNGIEEYVKTDHLHNKHEFFESLKVCLASNVGREYLYRYLQQTFCDEIAIFLKSLGKFKVATSDKERFMIARCIVKHSIEPAAAFSVNVSYETRTNARMDMLELERIFCEKEDLKVSKDMFFAVEREMHQLIRANHWRKFNQTFKNIEVSPI